MANRRPPVPVQPARGGRAGLWVAAIAVIYVAALWYLDRDRNILSQLAKMAAPLSACAVLVLLGYACRYQRWRSVLAAQGHPVRGWWPGLVAYLAGFAFTASPGKAGELLRIRYFNWQGIPPQATLTTFIFERACDLLVITLLSIAAAPPGSGVRPAGADHPVAAAGIAGAGLLATVGAVRARAGRAPARRASAAGSRLPD